MVTQAGKGLRFCFIEDAFEFALHGFFFLLDADKRNRGKVYFLKSKGSVEIPLRYLLWSTPTSTTGVARQDRNTFCQNMFCFPITSTAVLVFMDKARRRQPALSKDAFLSLSSLVPGSNFSLTRVHTGKKARQTATNQPSQQRQR